MSRISQNHLYFLTLTPGALWNLYKLYWIFLEILGFALPKIQRTFGIFRDLLGFPLAAKLVPLKLNISFENVNIQSWGPSMQPKPILCHSSGISMQFECSLTATAVQWTISNGNECAMHHAVASHVLSAKNCLHIFLHQPQELFVF